MLKLNTPSLVKVAGSSLLVKADKMAAEALIAAGQTSKEINTETKFILGGLAIDSFSEELSTAASMLGITVDPVSISTFGKALAVGGGVSIANKFYNNFSDIDLNDLSEEEIINLMDFSSSDTEVIEYKQVKDQNEL